MQNPEGRAAGHGRRQAGPGRGLGRPPSPPCSRRAADRRRARDRRPADPHRGGAPAERPEQPVQPARPRLVVRRQRRARRRQPGADRADARRSSRARPRSCRTAANGADFILQGHVRIGADRRRQHPGRNPVGRRRRATGAERGRIVQLNEVPAGTLTGYWGDVAVVVAEEAAGGRARRDPDPVRPT